MPFLPTRGKGQRTLCTSALEGRVEKGLWQRPHLRLTSSQPTVVCEYRRIVRWALSRPHHYLGRLVVLGTSTSYVLESKRGRPPMCTFRHGVLKFRQRILAQTAGLLFHGGEIAIFSAAAAGLHCWFFRAWAVKSRGSRDAAAHARQVHEVPGTYRGF